MIDHESIFFCKSSLVFSVHMDTKEDPSEDPQKKIPETALEQQKLGLMRILVEKEDPSSKEVDDMMLRRFLRARNLDIEKAASQFLKYLKWREAVPYGSIVEAEISNQLAHKKAFRQGFDKNGRPVGVILAARHFYTKGNVEEIKRLTVYILDKCCASMPRGQEMFTFIGDLEGWGYSNFDFRAYLAALDILQNFYPERLGKLFVVHVPYIFWTAWKIIYPFIDNNTKKKIVFVENKKLRETLLEDIDESELPELYGGKLPLVPIEEGAN